MSLFSALSSTANSLTAFENALTVTQNNISNSSTPGYAAQAPTFEALPFDEQTAEGGGVQAGTPSDTRDAFAEQNVQANSSQAGMTQQQVQSLTSLQSLFDISGKTGIPSALSGIYSAFSSWASSPSSATNQQAVLNAASTVASAFQQTASQVSQVATSTASSLSSVVAQVNALAAQLSGYNTQIAAGDGHDPGLQAEIYNALQQLSQLTNISTLSEANGTVTVLLGNGQTSLVDGSTANALNVSFSVPQPPPPLNPDGPPSAQVTDSSGKNITSEVTSGQIGGLLNVYNSVLPSIQGDGSTTGSLNQLAKSFADRVNSLLTSGVVSAGPPVVNGTALFTYDPTNATNTAASLAVNPLVTTSSLAASSGLEDSTNAAATSLSSFANPTSTPVSSTGNMELTVGSSQYSINLTGQNNLQGLVSAINASGAPVSASIITGQSGDYLSVSATSAGATTLQLKDDPAGANTPFLTAIDGTNSNGTALALAALESSTNASALSSSSYATATATPVSSSPTFAMTLVVGSNQYSINLTGQNNLQGLVSAINASGAPVSASVASTPAGDYLSISANSAGSNALQLIDDPGGANKSLLTADSLAGQTYSGYFGGIAAGVGTDLSNATSAQSQAQNGLTQAESLRQQVSGVNLNQQATQVLQFQQAYEAASKVISVIDDLTQAAINIIQPSQIV